MKKTNRQKQTDHLVFETAHDLWSAASDLRKRRERSKRYTYGDQWGDLVRNKDGAYVPESEVIVKTGRRPATNNLIRRLVKAIIGRYRDMADKEGWYNDADIPGLDELDSRLLEEFLISGIAVQRTADDDPMNRFSPRVRNVSPPEFFINDFRDPLGCDIDIIGMLHDMSPGEARMRFGKSGFVPSDRLDPLLTMPLFNAPSISSGSVRFFEPSKGRRRVVEIWSREFGDDSSFVWHCRWFAPDGTLLDEYDSPWSHGMHPFTVKFYPLTDGEVHPFVEDVIDQQRYINRLVVLIDRILSTSAKGVLLFPVKQRLEGCSWEEIARQWSSPDGVIPISGIGDITPSQMNSSGGDANAYRLLELEMKLFDEVSGVSSALTGASSETAGVNGANLYQARIENATIALADIYRTFRSAIEARDAKLKTL